MKANELMIDDWVYNKNIDKPIQVYPVMFSQMFRQRPDATTEDYNIFPIPLTTEILEKNGWLSRMNGTGEFYLKEPLVDDAIVTKTIIGFQMNHGPFNGLPIHYVHELQHALHICGIEHNIKL